MNKVYLVGAGPGDPELLTLKGRRCLESADVVLYDHLASSALARLRAALPPNAFTSAKSAAITRIHNRKSSDLLIAQSQRKGRR